MFGMKPLLRSLFRTSANISMMERYRSYGQKVPMGLNFAI